MTRQRIGAIARQVAMTVALASAVTVAGVATGALLIAPAVSTVTDGQSAMSFHVPALRLPMVPMPRLPMPELRLPTWSMLQPLTSPNMRALRSRFTVPVLLTLLSLLALGRLASVRSLFNRTGRRSTINTFPPTNARARMRTPARPDRTPRAVEALAASGTAPSEISWRTGLPLDAVALLLSLSTAQRQLRPPSA